MGRVNAFGLCSTPFPLVKRPASSICVVRASQNNVQKASTPNPSESPGVNINKYKSQRSMLSAGKDDVTADEVNDLMIKAGKGVRKKNQQVCNFIYTHVPI